MGLFVQCLVVVFVIGGGNQENGTMVYNGSGSAGSISSSSNMTDPYLLCDEWMSCYEAKLWKSLVAFVVGGLAFALLCCWCGFTCCGIRGGSAASRYQSKFGTDPLFSSAQSTGAKGGKGFFLLGGIGAVLIYCFIVSRGCDISEPGMTIKLVYERGDE